MMTTIATDNNTQADEKIRHTTYRIMNFDMDLFHYKTLKLHSTSAYRWWLPNLFRLHHPLCLVPDFLVLLVYK